MLGNTIGTLFLSLCALSAHAEEFVLPPNDGFITDPGDSIPLMEEEELEQKMVKEKKQTGLSFVSVILPTLGGRDITHLAWELRTKWGIEQSGSGILLLIAREEGKALIAPGKSHEKVLTDTVLGEIIEADILPMLRRRKYAAAIEQGTYAVRRHLQGAFTEKRQKVGLPAKNTSYRMVMLLLVLLTCYVWFRARRQHAGRTQHRRQ
mgnify:CR=1 FL=1